MSSSGGMAEERLRCLLERIQRLEEELQEYEDGKKEIVPDTRPKTST